MFHSDVNKKVFMCLANCPIFIRDVISSNIEVGENHHTLKTQLAEQKKENISDAIMKIIAEKGYESATTRNIAKEAQVSHGILHYYFKDKEDMIAFALEKNIEELMQYAISLDMEYNSLDQLGKILVKYIKKVSIENFSYYRFLFTIWSVSWQNKRIKEILDVWHNKILIFMKEEINRYIIKDKGLKMIYSEQYVTSIASYLMFIIDGTIMHLLLNDKYIDDANLWEIIEKSVNALV